MYPLFAMLDTTQRIMLFTFAAALVTASSVSLKVMHAKLNNAAVAETKKTN